MISLVDAVKAIDLYLESDITGVSKEKAEVFYSQGSMLKLINKFIVTPTIIVSNSVKGEKVIADVIEHNVSLFTSLYSQVFTTLVSLHGISPSVAFELLSSSYETYYSGLPGTEDNSLTDLVAMEDSEFAFLPGLEASTGKPNTKKKKKIITRKRSVDAKIKDGDKNHIGKLITRDVEISIDFTNKNGDKRKFVIPVVIRANVIYTDFKNINNMLSKEDGESFLDRIDEYRAGAITIGDLIFANDLIKNYKKRRINDKDDLIREMRLRELNSASKLTKHGAAGFGKLYQMIIIGNDDAVMVEKQLRGSLHKERVKEAFLNATSSLTATIVDRDYERVVMFINDLKGSIDLSFKAVEQKSGKSDSMEELLKILMTTKTI